MTTATTYKSFGKPIDGSDNNTWGTELNSLFDLVDKAFGGTLSKSISTNTTLNSTEAQNTGFVFTGSLSGNATITWPTFYGFAAITNNTTGGFSLTCQISGTTVSIVNGETGFIWSDGTNFIKAGTTVSSAPSYSMALAQKAFGGI